MRLLRSNSFLLTLFLIWFINSSWSQINLSEIINLHKDNLRSIMISRGSKDHSDKILENIPKNFNQNHLIFLLKYFYKDTNVGILIYSHKNDSLTISLLDKDGIKNVIKKQITASHLEEHTNSIQSYVKNNLSKDKLKDIRGTITESSVDSLQYIKSKNILLPNKIDFKVYDHIIIVPTLNIGTIPFAALKLDKNSFLIDHLSYSISPSIFEVFTSLSTIARYDYNPDFFKFNSSLFVYKTDFTNSNYTNLKYTKNEVGKISSYFEDPIVLANENAKKNEIRRYLQEVELIYFATHGVTDKESPLDNSFLVLSGKNDELNYLTAREIQTKTNYGVHIGAHNFDKKMAVLSACNTGSGKSHKGGIIGLARAFQITGYNHVLMSLWSVSDYHTSKLMEYFFEELSKSKNEKLEPHNSLKKAITLFRKNISNNPIHWASFSIFGVPNPCISSYFTSPKSLKYLLKELEK